MTHMTTALLNKVAMIKQLHENGMLQQKRLKPIVLCATDTAKQKWFLTVNFPLLSTAKPKLTNNFQRTTTKKVPSPTQILVHICSCSFQFFFLLFLFSFLGNNLLFNCNKTQIQSSLKNLIWVFYINNCHMMW